MKKIREAIQRFIDKHVPCEIQLTHCDAGRIYGLYQISIPEPNEEWQTRMSTAIDRLTAQMPLQIECSHRLESYLIYEDDKKALARLCNNYCIWLAEQYDNVPFFMQPLATKLYNDFTTIMLKFK